MIDYNELLKEAEDKLDEIDKLQVVNIFIGNTILISILIFIYILGTFFTLWEFSIPTILILFIFIVIYAVGRTLYIVIVQINYKWERRMQEHIILHLKIKISTDAKIRDLDCKMDVLIRETSQLI